MRRGPGQGHLTNRADSRLITSRTSRRERYRGPEVKVCRASRTGAVRTSENSVPTNFVEPLKAKFREHPFHTFGWMDQSPRERAVLRPMLPAVLPALLVTMKITIKASKEQRMYPIDPIHPTELYRERQELLAQEARDARLARQLRAARRERTATSDRRTSSFSGRAMALWGRTSVPFFRA